MRITLAAVGKMKPSPEQDLLHAYLKRTPWQITLREVDAKKSLPDAQRILAEADLLREATAGATLKIMLDERGKSLGSEAFARQIGSWQSQGHSHLAFIIGGQDGLHESLRKEAALLLAFGAQTWPHMMVRAMFAEQIYRAHTILTGHPYHRS